MLLVFFLDCPNIYAFLKMKGFIYLSFHIIIKYRCTLFYPPKGILGRLLFIKTGKNSHLYIYIYVCVCVKKNV